MNAPDPKAPPPTERRRRLEEMLDSFRTPAERLNRAITVGGGILIALVILYVSALDTGVNLAEFVRGLPAIAGYVARMVPPDWEYAPRIVQPTLETIEIAIWGTVLGILLAIPLGLMAARNISPHFVVYGGARFVLNALRGVSELVFALIFVSAVGLGPFPGILALALHNAGMLGKFYAEAIEAIDEGPSEAMRSTGAGWSQTVAYAIVPQILPHFITYNLYRFEVSIRSATVLGLVGAGGIGFHLISSIRLFDYQTTAMILIVIIALVILTDHAGAKIRARIL